MKISACSLEKVRLNFDDLPDVRPRIEIRYSNPHVVTCQREAALPKAAWTRKGAHCFCFPRLASCHPVLTCSFLPRHIRLSVNLS